MIDVVFLLLIFFMTTASFVRTERNLASAIKVNRQAASQSASDLEPTIIEIVRSGDRFVFRLGQREFTNQTELADLLEQLDNKADGAFVRVSDEAPFGMAAAAIQACKSAGYPGVSYIPVQAEVE
jgi:biopolymer transport protein ExbD